MLTVVQNKLLCQWIVMFINISKNRLYYTIKKLLNVILYYDMLGVYVLQSTQPTIP